MRVGISTNSSITKDAVRGIGVHTNELIKALDIEIKNKNDIQIDSKIDKNIHYNVIHITSFKPFFISLPFTKPKCTKFVLTIHDLIPLIYPKVFKPGIKGKVNFLINKLLIKLYVDEIITISETSKKDICRFLGVDPKIIHVIYLGSKKEYKQILPLRDRKVQSQNIFKLPEKFIFYFGDINYNKNIPTLVKACEKLNILLVIAGKQAKELEKMDLNHPELVHLKPVYETLINSNKVKRLGYITDEEANKVLNIASVLVQPSYYEGFGLSIIHALAAGCPVIAGKTQALVEVGGDSCLYFDTQSADDLTEKINEVLNNDNLREKLIKDGFERIKNFSWEKTAKETLDVYEQA
jgi:glycosyltransferase involved in cell wall biosynthesis